MYRFNSTNLRRNWMAVESLEVQLDGALVERSRANCKPSSLQEDGKNPVGVLERFWFWFWRGKGSVGSDFALTGIGASG